MSRAAIYSPRAGMPMRAAFFASGGPGNLATAFEVEDARPDLVRIELIVTDRPGIPAFDLAQDRKRPTIVGDLVSETRSADADARRARTEAFHNIVLEQIRSFEDRAGYRLDLAVLAYRRIITGPLLTYFADRMINQHPADLAILGPETERPYVGIDGLRRMLEAKAPTTRTTTILVDEGVDTGEILCRGPTLPTAGRGPADVHAHEASQKRVSDAPSLRFALLRIAEGRYSIDQEERHRDGRRVICLDDVPLPYGGVDLEGNPEGIHVEVGVE